MEVLIGILVGGTIGAFAIRMAFDDYFKRARIRRALARGETQPALTDDVAPGVLYRLGLTEPFRIGEALGGRGELAGVNAEGLLELTTGEDFEIRKYLLSLRVDGITLSTEGMRRDRDDVETGDPTLDGLFVIKGSLDLIAARLDVDARRALVAAANLGWRARGDRLARSGVLELELAEALRVGLEAARRLLPGLVEDRLERTATLDPVMRMRRLALAALVRHHPGAAATRRVIEGALKDRDAVLQWLARTPNPIDEAWLRMASHLLLDATKAIEVAEILVWFEVTEALPGLGRALTLHPDGPVRAAIERARVTLAARMSHRVRHSTGGLALSDRDTGQLTLDD